MYARCYEDEVQPYWKTDYKPIIYIILVSYLFYLKTLIIIIKPFCIALVFSNLLNSTCMNMPSYHDN